MELIAYSNDLRENILFNAPENLCTAQLREYLEILTGADLTTLKAPAVFFCDPAKLPKKHSKKQLNNFMECVKLPIK